MKSNKTKQCYRKQGRKNNCSKKQPKENPNILDMLLEGSALNKHKTFNILEGKQVLILKETQEEPGQMASQSGQELKTTADADRSSQPTFKMKSAHDDEICDSAQLYHSLMYTRFQIQRSDIAPNIMKQICITIVSLLVN